MENSRGNNRRFSIPVRVGNCTVGGEAPISIQSMTNTDSADFEATYAQVKQLEEAGCDIVRITVPNKASAGVFNYIKNKGVQIPLVADIHFDYRIAVESIFAGADKIRINPGNIGSDDRVKAVVGAARQKNVPIRIGVNSGSLEKEILAKYKAPTAEALAQSVFYHVHLLEKFDFTNIIVAAKSSDPKVMMDTNRMIASGCEYPIHLGVTESGIPKYGILKSAVGIGALLCDGIGDTVRISLTADPVNEVAAAKDLLCALSLYHEDKISVVSCPTCGRTQIDLIALSNRFEKIRPALTPSRKIKVAIMGCIVNGPGS